MLEYFELSGLEVMVHLCLCSHHHWGRRVDINKDDSYVDHRNSVDDSKHQVKRKRRAKIKKKRHALKAFNFYILLCLLDMSLPLSRVQAEENTEGNAVTSVETSDQQRQRAEQLWLSCVLEWFPNLHQQTYFLPPLHFNRVPYKIQTVCGQVLLVPQQAEGYASQVSPSDVSNEPSVGSCQFSSLSDSEQSLATPSSTVGTTQQQLPSLPTPSGQDHLPTTSSLPSAQPSQIDDLVSSPKERSLHLESSQLPSHESSSKTTSPLPSSAQTARGIWDPLTLLPPRLPVVLDSDVRDDRALQHVLCCLRALGERQREVMMVISQMQFGKYLNKPVYSAAAALLPRPINLAPQYHRGDFDLLIIHHKYGLIIGEVKSVGSNFALLNKSEEEKDALIVRAVDKSIAQLNRAQYVLKYMVTDFPNLNIRKTLIMPNISSGHLSRALNCSIKVQKDLCLCLEVPEVSSAIGLCLCADHLSSNTTTDAVPALHLWWQQLVKTVSSQSLMPNQDYERLIARFCGPATTVEVFSMMSPHLELRTIGDGVSETGKRLAHLTLYPDQVELLSAALPRMFLTGPPGTGKTVMLVLQGLQWLQKGYGVHVVSTWREGLAASFVVEYQLVQTWVNQVNQTLPGVSASCNRVHRHQYQIQSEEDTILPVSQLSKYCDTGQIGVLIDEAGPDNWFSKFCDKLVSRIPDIVLWAASVNQLRRPACLEERLLTVALRSPPVVVRQVSESQEILTGKVLPYKSVNIPPPTDGPPILQLAHHDRPGHIGIFPDECEQCGHAIANILNYLGVAISETRDVIRPPPLQYCDVLVLCSDPCEDHFDSKGNVITKGNGLVRGLRSCKVPVCVVKRINNDDLIRRVALAMCDEVTVAHWDDVKGLERRVVVVPGYLLCHDVHHRLYAVSRCSSQLVIIE